MYLLLAIETINYPKFGIRQQKLTTMCGKNKKLYQILLENGVAALKTICYEKQFVIKNNILSYRLSFSELGCLAV